MILMGSRMSWYAVFFLVFFFSDFYSTSGESNRDSLDSLIQEYAIKSLSLRPRTGTLYKASLPSNFSGIDVSVVRLRAGSLWTKGAYFSGVNMEPRIIAIPFVRRLDIVYQNLGNWSNFYYNVPGYSMVTPVVGFLAYNASNTTAYSLKINLSVLANPISIHFPKVLLPQPSKGSNSTLQCVRFAENGTIEFSKMASDKVCFTRDDGHFAIVVEAAPSEEPKATMKKKERLWKWLVVGFVLGFVGLVVIGLIGVVAYKIVKVKKIGEMEKRADEGESFDTIWIGMSKMPSATVIRTQPVLEREEIP